MRQLAPLPPTRLQGELQAASAATRRGLLATALAVVRAQGVTALYRGLPAAVARHIPYTGIRITVFEQLKRGWAQHAGGDGGGALPLPINLAIGATSGGLAQAAAVPMDLVKVRLQADGRAAAAGGSGSPPRYRGFAHALCTIWREEGGRGLWAGSAPAVYRAALVNLGELTAYSQAKQAVVGSGLTGGDNAGAHAASSLVSGFVASVASTPADVVKTRLMNQGGSAGPGQRAGPRLYRGMADCFLKTLRAEGWRGLYKG